MSKQRSTHRQRGKDLGVTELVAIALGGMVGGGIFTILGICVALIGVYTPVAIILGGILASFAAYAYVKLGVYYQDEGATYFFFKRTFPKSPFAASLIGWWVVFGYISTMALYAYTFASYLIGALDLGADDWLKKAVAGAVILGFTIINLVSVKGMGKLEDLMVYSKLIILAVISFVLINNSNNTLPTLLEQTGEVSWWTILIVASLTFVAYEGFQLVINAMKEMDNPKHDIPRAIYTAIVLAIIIYVVIALGAILAIPFADIVANEEYALAAGANGVLGHWGTDLVILGALLATSSAISGTVFGASRQLAVIAGDGYFPAVLAKRSGNIPKPAIVTMSVSAFGLILIGDLQMILEFGSITFLLVSLLMAYTNFKIRDKTQASVWVSLISIAGLAVGTLLILYYEAVHAPEQLIFTVGLYVVLAALAWLYAKMKKLKV